MESSQKNARILEVIGYVQFLLYTVGTVFGIYFLENLSVILIWIIGIILLGFYIRHSRAKQIINKQARRFWLGSSIYNAIGCIVSISITRNILSSAIRNREYYRIYPNSFDPIDILFIVWSVVIALHTILSFRSFRSLYQTES